VFGGVALGVCWALRGSRLCGVYPHVSALGSSLDGLPPPPFPRIFILPCPVYLCAMSFPWCAVLRAGLAPHLPRLIMDRGRRSTVPCPCAGILLVGVRGGCGGLRGRGFFFGWGAVFSFSAALNPWGIDIHRSRWG